MSCEHQSPGVCNECGPRVYTEAEISRAIRCVEGSQGEVSPWAIFSHLEGRCGCLTDAEEVKRLKDYIVKLEGASGPPPSPGFLSRLRLRFRHRGNWPAPSA